MANNIQYNSNDIRKKEGASYFTKVRQKNGIRQFFAWVGKTRLIIFGIVVLLIGIGLITTLIIINNRSSDDAVVNKEDAMTRIARYEEKLSEYIFGNASDELYSELASQLEALIQENESPDITIRARTILANLYFERGNPQLAFDIINAGLEDDTISDQNRFALLTTIVDFYDRTGQQTQLVDIISQIISLPDDMELEHEDWSIVKAFYRGRLELIMGNGE